MNFVPLTGLVISLIFLRHTIIFFAFFKYLSYTFTMYKSIILPLDLSHDVTVKEHLQTPY